MGSRRGEINKMNLYERVIQLAADYYKLDNIEPRDYKRLLQEDLVKNFFKSLGLKENILQVYELVKHDYDIFLHPLSVLSLVYRLPRRVKTPKELRKYQEDVTQYFNKTFPGVTLEHLIILTSQKLEEVNRFPCLVEISYIEKFENNFRSYYNIIGKDDI